MNTLFSYFLIDAVFSIPLGVMVRQAFLRILLFLNLFQFLFKSSSIHLARYGQTEREG